MDIIHSADWGLYESKEVLLIVMVGYSVNLGKKDVRLPQLSLERWKSEGRLDSGGQVEGSLGSGDGTCEVMEGWGQVESLWRQCAMESPGWPPGAKRWTV